LLSLDVEDVDLENRRRAVVGSKGGDIELLHFQTGSARLLPRLIAGRACGPLFLTDRRPAPGRAAAFVGACPLTGRVRLSYRRAEEIFRDASGGWTLHQLRYSAITHLAEGNVGLALLMAKRSLAIRTKWRLPPRRRAGGCAPVLKASGPRPRSEAVAPPESAGILVRWLQQDSWANPITTLGFTGPCRKSSMSARSTSSSPATSAWWSRRISRSACSTAPARLYAIEDRCSHDNGTLVEGVLDQDERTIECPPLGSLFDLKTGRPKSLPAYVPVDTFPVIIDEEMIKLEVE